MLKEQYKTKVIYKKKEEKYKTKLKKPVLLKKM